MTVNLRTEDSVESLDVGSALRHCVVAMHRRGFLSRGLVNAIKTAERSLLVLLHTAFHTIDPGTETERFKARGTSLPLATELE